MFNVALGFAFLLSFLTSVGGKLLSIVLEEAALRTMPPYQGVLAGVIANYWLPAILIYIVLKILRAERYLRAGVVGHVLFAIPNTVLCVYLVLRVFTSTIQGGGATFALASISRPFILVAPYILGAAVVWLAVRSVWLGIRLGPRDVQATGPAFKTAGPIIAVVMIVPAFVFLAWLYAGNMEKIGKATDARRAKAARFQELCQTARIDIYRKVNDAKSVLFVISTNAIYPLLEKLDFVEVKYESRDKLQYVRLYKKPGEAAVVQGKHNANRTVVAEPEAQYEISTKPMGSPSDTAMSLYVEEATIRDRRTNDVLAVFTAIAERRSVVRGDELFCPEGFEYVRYQAEVPSYVLGLMDSKTSKDFEGRLAVFKSKTSARKSER
jgi:hypothetical protein